MSNERVLVTGGSGFIGSHLTEKLLSLGCQVIVLDSVPLTTSRNLESIRDHKNLTYVEGDIRDPRMVCELVTRDIVKIYHLAAIVGVKNYCADPFKVIDVNVLGTRNILEMALKYKTPVVLASTSEIYGKNPSVPWQEDSDRVLGSTLVDRWSYSSSKAITEHLVLGLNKTHGLPTTIVRYFNVYGPRQEPYYVVSQTIQKVLCNESPLLYDSGHQTRCFTFVADAVEGTLLAANHSKSIGEVFNIGSPQETTICDVIQLIIRLSSKEVASVNLDTKKHYGNQYEDIPRRIPDVSKAKRILNWSTKTSLEEGIVNTMNWARQNPWWLERRT